MITTSRLIAIQTLTRVRAGHSRAIRSIRAMLTALTLIALALPSVAHAGGLKKLDPELKRRAGAVSVRVSQVVVTLDPCAQFPGSLLGYVRGSHIRLVRGFA